MPASLDTTNLFLGIIAVVSVLEALALLFLGVMGYRLYAKAMRTMQDIEERRIAPLVARVDGLMNAMDAVLVDVKIITNRVATQTARVDSAIRSTMHRVDDTAERVRDTVADRVQRFI